MYQYLEFCSDPECKHKTTYDKLSDPKKFCTVCGKPMIYECPDCKNKFDNDTNQFCPECGRKIK